MSEFSLGFALYFVVIASIAIYAYRRTHTDFDYDIGGRSLSAPVAALSAGASDMSGWLLLGLPGAIYLAGLEEAWIVVGLLIGAFLNWQFVAPRLRLFTGSDDARIVTLPQFFKLRTDNDGMALRVICSVVVIVFFAVYTAAGFVASAKLFQSIVGWDYQVAVLIGAVIIMVYTAVGGFLAVSWTDAFQALLMLLALMILPMLAFDVRGDVPLDLKIESVGFIGFVSLLAWGLGYFGQPHVLARFMAMEHQNQVARAKYIGMSWMLATTVGAIAIGLVGASLVPDLQDSETVFIRVAELLLNPWIAGVLIAAILAAVMSTVDSQLIVASTSIVNDLFKVKSGKLLKSRAVVIAVALCAGFIAMNENSVILDIVAYAWAGLGASFGPAVLFSLFWRKTTGLALAVGVLVGALTTIVWHTVGTYTGGIFADLYEIVPAFLAASVAIVIVSRVFPDSAAESIYTSLEELTYSSTDARES